MYKLNEDQELWLEALESGKYEQAEGVLYDGEGYCCLGVACEVFGVKRSEGVKRVGEPANFIRYTYGEGSVNITEEGDVFPGQSSCVAPLAVGEKLKLKDAEGNVEEGFVISQHHYSSLVEANDNKASFKQIAAAVRDNPGAFFHD